MRVFFSGGSKSGKSLHAQQLAKKMHKPGRPLYYLATMIPTDGEDAARIKRHRRERDGWGFVTVEAGRNILAAVGSCDIHGAFLLDSVTALLANEMFLHDGGASPDVYKKVSDDLTVSLGMTDNIVVVSDFIYSDAVLYDGLTETFRRGLAYIDRQMARVCDVVLEACAGLIITHKGGELLNEFD